jgi:hypothetical protein
MRNPHERGILLLRSLVENPDLQELPVMSFYFEAGCTGNAVMERRGDEDDEGSPLLPMWLEHPAGSILFPREEGIHLIVRPGGGLVPVEAEFILLTPSEDARAAARARIEEARSAAVVDRAGTILRMYAERDIVDLRTGLIAPAANARAQAADILLAQLPLPPELEE